MSHLYPTSGTIAPLSFEESRARLAAAIGAAMERQWQPMIDALRCDIVRDGDMLVATQARAMLAWAHWMCWDFREAREYGLWVLRTAIAQAGADRRPQLRYWLFQALSPTLAALRCEILSSAAAQLRLLAGLAGDLEHHGRARLDPALRATRMTQEILALASEARLSEAMHLYHLLRDLADHQRSDTTEQDGLTAAEFFLGLLDTREPVDTWYPRWSAAIAGDATGGRDGGLGELLKLWSSAERDELHAALPRMPLAWLVASVYASAADDRVCDFLGDELAARCPEAQLQELVGHRIGHPLAAALVRWCHRDRSTAATRALAAQARRERKWACLLM